MELWLDGSMYQGEPNFVKVKQANIVGVVWNLKDPNLNVNARNIVAAGLKLAFYYYLNANEDPTAAAQSAIAKARGTGVAYAFIALDLEEGAGDQTGRALVFLRYVKTNDNPKQPWFYSGGWYTNSHIEPNNAELATYPFWDAAYTGSEPPAPPPWKYISMWQYTSSGSVPGISGNVDMDRLMVTLGTNTSTPQPPAPQPIEEPVELYRVTVTDGPDQGQVWALGPGMYFHIAGPATDSSFIAAKAYTVSVDADGATHANIKAALAPISVAPVVNVTTPPAPAPSGTLNLSGQVTIA